MNESTALDTIASTTAQFQVLRAHVEREVRRSSVIMVTSAERRDGKSLTAYWLARCLAESGLRTALVDATPSGQGSVRIGHASVGGDTGPTILTLPRIGGSSVREAAAAFVDSARADYDYTIVDTATLLTDNVALALAGYVDGILVSVRVGRAASKKDDATMQIIESFGGRILGVVAAQSAAIAAFAIPSHPESAPTRVERRDERATTMAMQSTASMVAAVAIIVGAVVLSKWFM